jgi:hypothetical protein
MGLKITTPIGTDNGITEEAYVRISNYHVSKAGYANFSLQLFMSNADAQSTQQYVDMPRVCRNNQIGDNFNLPMLKNETRTRKVQRPGFEDVVIEGEFDEEGNPVTQKVHVMVDVDEEYTVQVPDISPLETVPLFTFAYEKLKEQLGSIFGEDNVVDC